jgi:N4-gp56 family major capsid protein
MASQIAVGGTDVAGLWTDYILRDFVPGLEAELLFANYAEPAMIPRGAGGYIATWNIPTMREGSVSALSACSSGTVSDMITITRVTAAVTSYGEWFEIDDLAEQSEISEALDQYKEMVKYAGAAAIDRLIINAADGTANFLHVGDTSTNGAALTAGDDLKAVNLPVVASYFRANNAKGWPNLSNDYMLAVHPNAELTMVTDVTTAALSWSEVNKHVPQGFQQLIDNHRFVGRLNGVSVLRTTQIATVTEDVAAYVNIALARWGVGWLGLGEKGPKAPMVKLKRPGPQSTNDPLDMCNTLGWRVNAVAQLLDSNRALVVYSDAS